MMTISMCLTMEAVHSTQTSQHKTDQAISTINNFNFGCGVPLTSLKFWLASFIFEECLLTVKQKNGLRTQFVWVSV